MHATSLRRYVYSPMCLILCKRPNNVIFYIVHLCWIRCFFIALTFCHFLLCVNVLCNIVILSLFLPLCVLTNKSHYIILFKSPRDANQLTILARQMYPTRSKFAQEAYRDATERPFGYIFIDLKPQQDERYRLRTNIFRGKINTSMSKSRRIVIYFFPATCCK